MNADWTLARKEVEAEQGEQENSGKSQSAVVIHTKRKPEMKQIRCDCVAGKDTKPHD